MQREKGHFAKAAQRITHALGSVWAVGMVAALAAAWLIVGEVTGFPRWWEITGTTGLPFLSLLMLVVIQHTQNHDSRAMHLKLDELIRANQPAENRMMTIEDAGSETLEHVRGEFRRQAEPSDSTAD